MKRLLPFSALAVFAASPAVAQQGTTERQSEAYQASVTQDGLRRDAASVRAELVRVREQMRQLLPEDVATVDRAIQQLDALSEKDMQRVIQALRGASKPEGLSGEAKALADALRDQGTISTSLKKLAVSLDARQSMEGLSGELSALLRRQIAAKDELARISRKDPTPDKLRNRDHERWEVVNEDQRRVSEDLKLIVPKIQRLASSLTGPAQERFTKAAALARDGKLPALADQAAVTTAAGPFDQAIAAQGGITALLVSMQTALGDASQPADRLAALSEKLKQTLEQQQAVTTNIAGFREKQSVERDTKQLQMTISDQIAALKAELQPLNAQAAAQLDAAQEATESASRHYEKMWEERADAQQNTRDAVAAMQAAVQSVDKQVAALPKLTPATAQELDAALAALQRDTAQAALAAARNAAPNAPPATADQQQALQKQVNELQQRALPISPEATQALNEASKDLREPGAANQQAAAQQLAKAQQALAQQQAALEGRSPAQQALAQAEAQTAQAQQALTKPQGELASEQTAAEAVNDLNAVRQQIAAAQRAAAQAGAPADVLKALAEAAQDIAQAQTDAAQVKLGQAQAEAKAGQQALARAQQGMAAARQAQQQQAAGALASGKGTDPGQRGEGTTPQGQGNGGGGKSGDNLAGAGDNAEPPAPVSGLNPQDRAAVAQLQNEKPPAEFLSEVQQYYKNIADGAGL